MCRKGKACGDSCIVANKACHKEKKAVHAMPPIRFKRLSSPISGAPIGGSKQQSIIDGYSRGDLVEYWPDIV